MVVVMPDANISAAIDSSVTEWYLPQSVCDQFASAFGLTYDNTTELYFVSDQAYNTLNATRPNITISISPSTSNSSSVDLVFPWAAFDLTALYPYQGLTGSQRFFPIRRASSADQYTLGRAFLQEAYIAVDYERRHFNVGQAVFSTPMPKSDIVTIWPSNGTNDTDWLWSTCRSSMAKT